MSVEIYTKPACSYCIKAKALLNQKNIPFKEFTVGTTVLKEDIQKRVASLGISVDIKTVPQIFYTDKTGKVTYVGGYTELVAKQAILGT